MRVSVYRIINNKMLECEDRISSLYVSKQVSKTWVYMGAFRLRKPLTFVVCSFRRNRLYDYESWSYVRHNYDRSCSIRTSSYNDL